VQPETIRASSSAVTGGVLPSDIAAMTCSRRYQGCPYLDIVDQDYSVLMPTMAVSAQFHTWAHRSIIHNINDGTHACSASCQDLISYLAMDMQKI
jgi:hypothetical protein